MNNIEPVSIPGMSDLQREENQKETEPECTKGRVCLLALLVRNAVFGSKREEDIKKWYRAIRRTQDHAEAHPGKQRPEKNVCVFLGDHGRACSQADRKTNQKPDRKPGNQCIEKPGVYVGGCTTIPLQFLLKNLRKRTWKSEFVKVQMGFELKYLENKETRTPIGKRENQERVSRQKD